MTKQQIGASFRDPSGFVFRADAKLYRQINASYANNHNKLMSSGLYSKLTGNQRLTGHNQASTVPFSDKLGTVVDKIMDCILTPAKSYPHEWRFSRIKDATVATLNIMERK